MKMPHANDNTLRSAQSPHQYQHHEVSRAPTRSALHNSTNNRLPQEPPRYYDNGKMQAAEMSPHGPRQDAYPPHRSAHPQPPHQGAASASAFHNDPTHNSSSSSTPPPSPHVPALRNDYASSYEGPFHPPHGPPVSHRGGAGYSYFHHHPNSQPPPMMDSMHPHHLYHHPHPEMMGGPPPPPHYSPSRYPPHPHSSPYESPPPPHFEYNRDPHQYPHFLPPSASMTTTGSSATTASMVPRSDSADEDYYYRHPYDAAAVPSPQSMTSMHPQSSSSNEVDEVGENDVLCGRGAPTNYHQGNEYFRDLVKEYQGSYLASKRADKPFIATHVVNIIQSRGGRFLRRYKRNGVSWERGHFVWVEVDPQKAYEKACQALREGAPELRRKMKSSTSHDEGSDTEEATVNGKEDQASAATATTGDKDGSAPTQQPGERMQESEGETSKKDGAQHVAAATDKKELTDDDRNDEMEDSERS